MAEVPKGCARITGKVAGGAPDELKTSEQILEAKETKMSVQVGQKAPEFVAPAYYKGEFTSVKLSDFAGKWVMVCFYPGDFTFV